MKSEFRLQNLRMVSSTPEFSERHQIKMAAHTEWTENATVLLIFNGVILYEQVVSASDLSTSRTYTKH